MMTDLKINTGDIVRIDLDPSKGDEMKKTRPCLVLEGNGHSRHELIIVLPITNASPDKKGGLYIPLAKCGLSKPSVVDVYQIRSVSTSRILEKIGKIRSKDFDKVRTSLAILFEIREKHIPNLKGQ